MSGRMLSIASVFVNQLANMRTGRRREREVGRNNDPDIDLQALILAGFDPVSGNLDVVIGKLNDFHALLPQLVSEKCGPD